MFLRGDRDYIQGTQIIARASETLEAGPWRFERTGFSAITRNLIAFADQDTDGSAIGTVCFVDDTGAERILHVIDSGAPAPHRDQPIPAAATRQESGAAAEPRYAFSRVRGFEDMLNAIVIAIKTEHTVRFTGCTDIWLTGMRGLNLPVEGAFPENGQIGLQMMRALAGEKGQQTLWRVDIQANDGTAFARGAVTFSYKPGA
ncbi:hypothetical protein [Actibacterium ureilyticum]|uniref:hypothetical protein n=1 Tax=Actibacterium ureilyticum TaxID=1590614 RepID=UPI000BAB16A1|nr:hypothetical protein [Actibacterium ureilyticum]